MEWGLFETNPIWTNKSERRGKGAKQKKVIILHIFSGGGGGWGGGGQAQQVRTTHYM